jgi:nitroreductase
VSDEALDSIVEAARRAPTSSNAHRVSLVVARDAVKRARIAELAGGQTWIAKAPVFIAVLLDFYKTGVAVGGSRFLLGLITLAASANIWLLYLSIGNGASSIARENS